MDTPQSQKPMHLKKENEKDSRLNMIEKMTEQEHRIPQEKIKKQKVFGITSGKKENVSKGVLVNA